MDLSALMEAMASKLRTIDGLRVYKGAPDSISVPSVVVGFPSIEYDYYRRGTRLSFPVRLIIGRVSDTASLTELNAYINIEGSKSIKAVLEADPSLNDTASTVRVQEVETGEFVKVGDIDYLQATFKADVVV